MSLRATLDWETVDPLTGRQFADDYRLLQVRTPFGKWTIYKSSEEGAVCLAGPTWAGYFGRIASVEEAKNAAAAAYQRALDALALTSGLE